MIAIFDLDGVITAEQIYWVSAGEALAKLLGYTNEESQIPLTVIAQIKSLAVNSNWDLAYILFCCDHISRSRGGKRGTGISSSPLGWDETEVLRQIGEFSPRRGFALLQAVGAEADRSADSNSGRFVYRGTEYERVHKLCQEVHEGRLRGASSLCLEEPAVPLADLLQVLQEIQALGVAMGVATGRPRTEAQRAMKQFGIANFFQSDRVVCYDDIVAVEAQLATDGKVASLTKPHPFSILRAAYPGAPVANLMGKNMSLEGAVAYIGDTVSDVLAARAAGATSIGVLTGVPDLGELRASRKSELISAGCDHVIMSVLEVPRVLTRSLSREATLC